LELHGFREIPGVSLEQIRGRADDLRKLKDDLDGTAGGTTYFPFSFYQERPLRPAQGYLVKLPAAVVGLLDEIAGGFWLGTTPLSIAPTEIFDPEELLRKASALTKILFTLPPIGNSAPRTRQVASRQFGRNAQVVAWVLQQAGDVCELCQNLAPFRRADGTPYLEVHHVVTLAEGGADSVSNAVALCPNCHRRLHYAPHRLDARRDLYRRVSRLRH